MTEVRRITPAEARQKVTSGKALFVCAYESEALCQRNHPEGGIPLADFTARLPSLGKEQEIIFYCV
ncbi:MAG TPA: ArsR family transcriptional regulator [Geobacteraceae bacterium]|nr:ArsR family transcriptional regulator [Geobacteraceae bacterium]